MMKIFYLGPPGTYSYKACLLLLSDLHLTLNEVELIPVSNLSFLLKRIIDNPGSLCVSPFQNTSIGIIAQMANDLIAKCKEIKIKSQVVVRVDHCLYKNKNCKQIKRIYSHKEALSQCLQFLSAQYADCELISCDSTVVGVEKCLQDEESGCICSEDGVQHVLSQVKKPNSLELVKSSIQNLRDNFTSFLIIMKAGSILDVSIASNSKSSIVVLPLKRLNTFFKNIPSEVELSCCYSFGDKALLQIAPFIEQNEALKTLVEELEGEML
jgi:chorismate mutase / prephenate dehydratase